MPNMGVFSG